MAEAPDVRKTSLEQLEREITCSVCQGHYQQAKLLPCNHYYCGTCIEKLAERSRGKPFDCPECRIKGDPSTPWRRSRTAERVLCGENERRVRPNGEGRGKDGGGAVA